MSVWTYTYFGFSQRNALFGILIAHSRERNLWVQKEEPAIDVGEGFVLARPLHMTYSGKRAEKKGLVESLWKDTHCLPTEIIKSTFEGGPDRNISQCQGMSNQEGPQRQSLVQFSQGHAQTGLTTQTLGPELQPVVHLHILCINIKKDNGWRIPLTRTYLRLLHGIGSIEAKSWSNPSQVSTDGVAVTELNDTEQWKETIGKPT